MENTIKLNADQTRIAKLLIKWYNKCLIDDSDKNQEKADYYADELACSLGINGMFDYERNELMIYDGEDWRTLELYNSRK